MINKWSGGSGVVHTGPEPQISENTSRNNFNVSCVNREMFPIIYVLVLEVNLIGTQTVSREFFYGVFN